MASMSSALLPLLLLCLWFYHVSGDEQGLWVVRVESLLPRPICSSPKVPAAGGNTLKVAHRRGPCSSFGTKPNPALTLRQDMLRVESLQRGLSGGAPSKGTQLQASQVSIPTRWGRPIGTGNYLVTVGFGSPRKDQTLVFDTGSNVCWIQCMPCAGSCYQQQDPLFDPSASSTYRNISCSSATCSSLDIRGCNSGTCVYGVQYGDQSTTVGFLVQDTLTLTPENVFQNFVFGCGQNNRGLFGRAAGLIGLGRDSFSLVSQTSQVLGGTFSYCLPATSSSTGYLTMGRSATSASYTPMLTDSRDPSLYSIALTGISLGGRLLPISPTVFQTSGSIIDSGTVITRLPPSAYAALRTAFRSAMSQYPMAQPLSILDTCYDFSKVQTIEVPTVVLHFDGGADLPLQVPGIFFVADISQVCLAFAGNGSPGDLGIIGNTQQKTTEVIYDLGARRIGFATKACS
ncbi:hypothetical protein Taro_045702 [Colocasia esculenta]|uniref:Peptidase A1 domain-containing protein n=1 Tax=Colocasia esculenta TaxID=4460 RepID=A0A843WMV4_COLES|nr:hypothetical protein [Colocasia esculenta]